MIHLVFSNDQINDIRKVPYIPDCCFSLTVEHEAGQS